MKNLSYSESEAETDIIYDWLYTHGTLPLLVSRQEVGGVH